MDALAISEWEQLQAGDDLDLIGPIAQRVLTRYGILSPFNVHLHLPILEKASGGSLLTGLGGDQILSRWRAPRPRTLLNTLRAAAPGCLAAAVRQYRHDPFPWLRQGAARRVIRMLRRETLAEPRRIERRMAWNACSRSPSRDFVRGWGGGGIDEDLVNPRALVELWKQWPPPAGTAGLIQQLWLSPR